MATPDFVLELRRHVGHAPLWMPGTTVVIARPAAGNGLIDWERPIGIWTGQQHGSELVEIWYQGGQFRG